MTGLLPDVRRTSAGMDEDIDGVGPGLSHGVRTLSRPWASVAGSSQKSTTRESHWAITMPSSLLMKHERW